MGMPDDEWDGLFEDDDPESLLRDGNRCKDIIAQKSTEAVQELYLQGKFDHEQPTMTMTATDRVFLRSIGISDDGREYRRRDLTDAAMDRIMNPVFFSARLTHLYSEIEVLERNGMRPIASNYAAVLEEALATTDVRYLKPGTCALVEGELDALAEEGSATLVPSARCLDLLRRVDATTYEYLTGHWPVLDLGGA